MNTRPSFALILTLLPSVLLGCVIPLDLGHSKVVVEGHLVGALTPGAEEERMSLHFCHTEPQRAITIGGDGRFSQEFIYSYGGVYMLFPPLGAIPKGTPAPPNICVSFPSEAGEYYLIRSDRDGASWRMLYRKPENLGDKPAVIPVLKQVDLKETNKRGSFNDWVLSLQFTK